MFDSRNTQIADNYQQFVESLIQNLRKIGSIIEELIKAIQEKEQSKKESSKVNNIQDKDNKLSAVDIQVEQEKYRLIPDEEFPGAWKWESAEMTNFQEQTVLRRLVTEPVVNPEVHPSITDVERDSSLSVVAQTKSGESIVVYHQDSKGSCRTNIVTENLEEQEIIDVVNEVITPDSNMMDRSVELDSIANELLSQILTTELDERGDKKSTEPPKLSLLDETNPLKEVIGFQNSDESLPQPPFEEEETVVFLDEDEPMSEPPIEDYLSDPWEEESSFLSRGSRVAGGEESREAGGVEVQGGEINNSSPTFSSPASPAQTYRIPSKPKQKSAVNYSYEQISDSDEVSPETKRWVREVEVPVSKAVANSQAEQARLKQENIKIAQTVVEMLKAYGEETVHGYEAYKSDAFVIKLEGSKYSIHHRRDELYYFGNPLMQFSLDSKGNPKIDIPPTQMLPVERQEFLMVGERLESGKELPQLALATREDIANNLGSLAQEGTFKAIQENHQWAEGILPIANNIFQASRLENRVESPSKGIEIVQGNNYQLQLNRNDKTMNISSINDHRTVASYDLEAKTVITASSVGDNRTVASYDLTERTVIAANPTVQDKQYWLSISQQSQVQQSKRNDIEL